MTSFRHHFSRRYARARSWPAWGNAADGHIFGTGPLGPGRLREDLSPRFNPNRFPEPIQIPTPPYPSPKEVPASVIQEVAWYYRTLAVLVVAMEMQARATAPPRTNWSTIEETPIRPFDFDHRCIQVRRLAGPTCSAPSDRTQRHAVDAVVSTTPYLYPREAFPDLNAWRTQVNGQPMFSGEDLNELQKYGGGFTLCGGISTR